MSLLRGTSVCRSAAALVVACVLSAGAGTREGVAIRTFQPVHPICRAMRPTPVTAVVVNEGDFDVEATARLAVPPGVRITEGAAAMTVRLGLNDGDRPVTWMLEADAAGQAEVGVRIDVGGKVVDARKLSIRFEPAVAMRKLPYIPEPVPAPTEILVGAHHCPLWEADKPGMWLNVLKHPERTPALGFYAQENPEVSDWETKWAVEHGISYFVYCWYRDGQGGPVKMRFGSAIHDALFKSRFMSRMKYTIMWENQDRGRAGVADENDLMRNLMPFWMENYFKHPGYLKVDNKPVLFIYRPEFLVDDLGGVTNVAKVFDRMRQACRDAGFDGLHILGEYRGLDPGHLKHMKTLGLDYSFAYCWPVPGSPPPARAVQVQLDCIRKTQAMAILPQVITVSQAWSGWRDEGSIWKIPPAEFEGLLREAKSIIATMPAGQLGSRMLLLDNWNEWGEGHYLAPYREHGFGYLDAVRRVFSTAPEAHEDLIPEDIGLGPYDTAIREHYEREAALRPLLTRKVVAPGTPEGLIGWWTFDEEGDGPVAFDHSGHRLGGALTRIKRAPGQGGRALVCDGGGVTVPGNPRLSPTNALSVECWVRTEKAGQPNAWMVNRVFGGGETAGYRMGVVNGHPCFQVPVTAWSHHLRASVPLPVGRWVHLAGTFDGTTMRIYVDGEERGSMERAGPVGATDARLVLGNFDVGHPAHFDGWLDDVRIYDRALPPEAIRRSSAAPGTTAPHADRRAMSADGTDG